MSCRNISRFVPCLQRFVGLQVFLLWLGISTLSFAQNDIQDKTVLMMKVANGLQWDSWMLNDAFVLGVAGSSNLHQQMLSVITGNSVKGKPITVRHVRTEDEIKGCNMLYLSTSSNLLLNAVVRRTQNNPVVLITERAEIDEKIDLNLRYNNGKWGYEINPRRIEGRGIKVSEATKQRALSQYAVRVEPSPKPITTPTPINKPDNSISLQEAQRQAEENKRKLEEAIKNQGLSPEEEAKLRKDLLEQKDLAAANAAKLNEEKKAKEAELKLRDEQNRREQDATNSRTRLVITISLSVILLVSSLALTFYIFSQRRKKIITDLQLTRNELAQKVEEVNSQNEQLEANAKELADRNRQITDSIRYALTIQQAMLPGEEILSKSFKEHFVVYEPKDIVSGDFYWLTHAEGKTFVAVVDCTGHGVPGAFMSTVGVDLLNEIVTERHVHNPAKVLEMLHLGIFDRLRQHNTNNRDGMDVCFCAIHPANNEQFVVTFAGAKRPLYYTRQQEILRLNGDSKYIGGISRERHEFNNHEILLHSGDMLYLTTDGYADTPNNRREKLGTQRFAQLLAEVHAQPLAEQKQHFLSVLSAHQGKTPSRDDITLLGIRL